MGKRFYIHVGDTTTSAGKVLTGLSTSTWHGIPNAFDGDAVECPNCGSVGQIRTVGSRISSVGSHGRQHALSGDLCLCKCNPPPRLVASQDSAWTEGEAGDVVMNEAARAGMAAAAFAGSWRAGVSTVGDAGEAVDAQPVDQRFLVRDEATGPARRKSPVPTESCGKPRAGAHRYAGLHRVRVRHRRQRNPD